jgi:hypothetical protein
MTQVLDPPMAPPIAALRELQHALVEQAALPLWTLSDPETLELRRVWQEVLGQVESGRLATTREIDRRGAAMAAGAANTLAWLKAACRVHPGEAKEEVALAAALDRDLPATAPALAAGQISRRAAAVVAATTEKIARTTPADVVRQAEALLVEHAQALDPHTLERVARHLRHTLDPDRGAVLEREENAARARNSWEWSIRPDGTSRSVLDLDAETTAVLRTAVDPLAAPRPAGPDGQPDPRPRPHRLADALGALAQAALDSARLPDQAGQPTQVVVHVPLTALQGAGPAPGAVLDHGVPISAETARRLACDALLVPAVLGAAGEPLDIGRASREPSAAIRRALVARDAGCAYCGAPARWCQAHHVQHWSRGGPTALSNLVLLCHRHHVAVHHDGWDVVIDADGLPTFHPPPWTDPARRPWRPPRPHQLL